MTAEIIDLAERRREAAQRREDEILKELYEAIMKQVDLAVLQEGEEEG